MLEQCGDANYAPLFMARSSLKKGNHRLDDLNKALQIEDSWRLGLALFNYYSDESAPEQMLAIASRYNKNYPDNYLLGLKYAKALCLNKQYETCISFLTKLKVLPYEAAYEGRAIYREAKLFQAINLMTKNKYDKALQIIHQSTDWIENLGVGKPYEEDIDSRFENYFRALLYEYKKDTVKSNEFYNKVIIQSSKFKNEFNSNDYLVACALNKQGEKTEANKLMSDWYKVDSDSKITRWCNAMYNNDISRAEELLSEPIVIKGSTPWEKIRNDYNFDLVVTLLKTTNKKYK